MMNAVQAYPGWAGLHIRTEAAGALCNGSRVRKARLGINDAHPIGARATVLGSARRPSGGYVYFVEWDDSPRVAVCLASWKIEPA